MNRWAEFALGSNPRRTFPRIVLLIVSGGFSSLPVPNVLRSRIAGRIVF